MRNVPNFQLSHRLISFVTLIVLATICVLVIGGTFTFEKMGDDYVDHNLKRITETIDKELAQSDDLETIKIKKWLPKLLNISNVVNMEVHTPENAIYTFRSLEHSPSNYFIYKKTLPLTLNEGFSATYEVIPPYSDLSYSLNSLFSVVTAVFVIFLFLLWGVIWLRKQLHGGELLEQRGRMLLTGRLEDYMVGDRREWPASASLALDELIVELKDARKERSRFDAFIRSNTFLDQLTGAANRVLFDSNLEFILSESDNQGVLLLLRINDFEEMIEEKGEYYGDNFIIEISNELNNIMQRYNNGILSRYYRSDFVILLPQQSLKEAKNIAFQCLKKMEKIVPPEYLEPDNWCHIGVSMYVSGESRGRLINELEKAHRSALLQNHNSWMLFKKQHSLSKKLGSVRWRVLFDIIFDQDKLILYKQSSFLFNGNKTEKLHLDLFSRIRDENGVQIKASHFLSVIELVGYEQKLDSATLRQFFPLLTHPDYLNEQFAIQLNVISLKNTVFLRQLKILLLQTSRKDRKRISIKLNENMVVKHLGEVKPIVSMLKNFGCKIIITQVGRTIVNTHYIKVLGVDIIKLHRSLVRDIHKRYENQLFILSLLGACERTGAKVIAVGVEKEKELILLKEFGVAGAQGRILEVETMLLTQKNKVILPRRKKRWKTP